VPNAPVVSCKESTRSSTGSPDSRRHSLRNGFTVSFALSPVTGLIATVALKKLASWEFDASVGASGPHDFAVRVPRYVFAQPLVHRSPRPTLMTMANAPLAGTG
jgi:hypothetical protein